MDQDVATRASGLAPVDASERVALRRQWYLVVVLAAIYVLNYIDRGALNLIVNPIKEDLRISDLQISLLIGLSFATLYSLLSIPAGYLADRMSRRLLLGGAIFFWSCMASLSGLAGNYWQLFAGRVGLGVGEAVLPPTAYSMLRDGVRIEHRARAFSIYHLGTGIGTALGALIGGSLFAIGLAGGFAGVPILGALKPWQLVIVVPGVAGIFISFLMATVREPRRGAERLAQRSNFAEAFRYVREHRRVYAPLFLSIVFGPMAVSAWGAWLPAAIGRMWGLPTAEIGHMTGYLALAVLPVNALIVGYLMDRVSDSGRRRDRTIWFAMAIGLLQILPALWILVAPSIPLMWVGYAGSMLLTNATGVAGALSLAQITPGRLMGKLTSFYFLIANLLGLAMGPTVTALVAQWFSGKLAIANAMMLCYPALSSLNILFLGIFATRLKTWQRNTEMT